MLKNLSKLKIEKRLSKSFTLVFLIASIAAVIGQKNKEGVVEESLTMSTEVVSWLVNL